MISDHCVQALDAGNMQTESRATRDTCSHPRPPLAVIRTDTEIPILPGPISGTTVRPIPT